jgi:hypothetical protein
MKFLRIINILIFAVFISNLFALPTNADSITAKFLDIPYSPKKDDFYYGGSAPFSIEFIGGESAKAKSCFDLTSQLARDFSVKWTIGSKSLSQSLFLDGGFVHTIGITKTGIQCAYLFQGGGLFDEYALEPLYKFSETESQVGLTLTLLRGNSEITSANGVLQNPYYSPPAPEIIGLNRGDVVNGFVQFNLKNADGSKVSVGPPSIKLCEVNSDTRCGLGWGKIQSDGSVILITVSNNAGKSASLNITYSSQNLAGRSVLRTTSVLIKIGEASQPIPWEYVKQFKDELEIDPKLECANRASGGKLLACSVSPIVRSKDSREDNSILKTIINFDSFTQLDSKIWQKSKIITSNTSESTKFSVLVPSGKWNRFQFKIDNGYLPQTEYSGIKTYGSLPTGPEIKLEFPNFVLWNQPFQISATSTKGSLSSCTFSMGGTRLGKANAGGGRANILVTAVWSGSPGSTTTLNYTATCTVSGKSVTGYGFVKGFR